MVPGDFLRVFFFFTLIRHCCWLLCKHYFSSSFCVLSTVTDLGRHHVAQVVVGCECFLGLSDDGLALEGETNALRFGWWWSTELSVNLSPVEYHCDLLALLIVSH